MISIIKEITKKYLEKTRYDISYAKAYTDVIWDT
jgi:hypothetical protein